MTITPKYNLLDQPCVPTRGTSGSTIVGLRELLLNAHEYTDLAPERPLASVALLRLLVTIVERMFRVQSRREREALWEAGHFDPATIDEFFGTHADRFDLFHPVRPFAQAAGLTATGGHPPKPASSLLLHAASGNNVPLFSFTTEGDQVTLGAAESFLALLEVLYFDTAAIKTGAEGDPQVKAGKTSGNPTGPLGALGLVIPQGRNVFETLVMNTQPRPKIPEDDSPIWLRELGPTWEVRQPRGRHEHLTWAGRRLRLVPDESGTEVIGAVLAAGDRMEFISPDLEPHTRWQADPKRKPPRYPLRWRSGQGAWRGLDSLLALSSSAERHAPGLIQEISEADWLPIDYPLRVRCVGVMYGNMSAVIEDVFVDEIPLPVAALSPSAPEVRQALIETVMAAESIRRALNDLDNNIRQSLGAERKPWDKGEHPGDDLMASLEPPTMRLLEGLQRQPKLSEAAQLAWEETANNLAKRVADRLLDAAPPQAFAGRKIKTGSKERTIRLADVEAWFSKAMRDALPRLAAQRSVARQEKEEVK